MRVSGCVVYVVYLFIKEIEERKRGGCRGHIGSIGLWTKNTDHIDHTVFATLAGALFLQAVAGAPA
jgi:hypothetical protein